jgi:hypothetical protein
MRSVLERADSMYSDMHRRIRTHRLGTNDQKDTP